MSTAEIRAPAEHERERVAEAMATSLNFQRERAVARSHLYDLDDMRVAVVGDEVVSTAGEFRFDQWFGERSLACSAIWGVTTLPEHRGTGLGSGVTESVLRAGRERGAVVSALFPAVMAPYRSLGFEMAGTFTQHRVAIEAIPHQPRGLPTPDLYEPGRDLADVRAAYRRHVSGHTGPVEPTADAHWAERIMHRNDDETRRAVVVREHGELTGFLVTGRDPVPGRLEVEFGLVAEAFVATTETALRCLLAYVRRFGGIGTWFRWSGPPNDAIALLLPDQSLAVDMHYRWMLRVLDVPGALEGRGWPATDAEAVFAVDDALFPDNAGPWLLRVEDGRATVTRHDGDHPKVVSIGVLSSMFTGYLRPADAVRLGALTAADPAVEAFGRLFSGPDPWCPFFF